MQRRENRCVRATPSHLRKGSVARTQSEGPGGRLAHAISEALEGPSGASTSQPSMRRSHQSERVKRKKVLLGETARRKTQRLSLGRCRRGAGGDRLCGAVLHSADGQPRTHKVCPRPGSLRHERACSGRSHNVIVLAGTAWSECSARRR